MIKYGCQRSNLQGNKDLDYWVFDSSHDSCNKAQLCYIFEKMKPLPPSSELHNHLLHQELLLQVSGERTV